ncbi:hypothetical protein [Halobacteriovorax sp. HLS]|uniref:hypothetical protein n=1 Tax=Halobacteriovorax sp. HLS TaxID=2234000 RepID=UPI000FD6FECD|nr:hypothetical protein [Halobacteriovorax sp. HLS]
MKLLFRHFDNHFHDGFRIEEIGFKLSKESNNQIKNRLRELMPKTPSTSFTTITFRKRNNAITAHLEISAAGQKFSSTAKGNDPIKVFDLIEADIDKQLTHWKKNRFSMKYFNSYDSKYRGDHFHHKDVAV